MIALTKAQRVAFSILLTTFVFCPWHSARADLQNAGTFSGNVGISIDGVGGNASPVGQIRAEIPVGASVVQAYLYTAGTPFPWYPDQGAPSSPTPLAGYNGGGITLGGTPILNFSKLVGAISDRPELGQWFTGRADVTDAVKDLVAANSAVSSHSWTYQEGSALNNRIDGSVLAIVYEEASLPESTVIILDGGQRTGGETSKFEFMSPISDPTDPSFFANMSLGISFSCCRSQVSQIDINGTRLSSSAGNNDDGGGVDGELITVGGIGDNPANPVDPFSENQIGDDELYNLAPLLSAGDEAIEIFTRNESNDDNIFFLAVHASAQARFVPEPSANILFGLGAAAMLIGIYRRRR